MPPVPSRSAMIMLRALAQPARLYSIQTRSSTYHQKLTKRSLSLFATSPRFIPIVYSKQHHLSQQQYRVGFDSRRNPPNRICPFSSTSLQATTLNQVRKQGRKPKRARRGISPAMSNRPEMKGVCLKVGVTKPKKPNSGQRKTAKVRLSTGRIISAYIPGEGHNVQQHSVVMVRGGRSQDCPGVRYHLVRGSLDLGGVPNRIQSRSKYGTKKPKSTKL